MEKPQNGFEFLEELRRQNGKRVQSYRSFFDYLDFKAREKGIPLHGQFELTPLCNFDCKMCYVHLNNSQSVNQDALTTDTWKSLIRQAFELGMMSATLTGGECLLYPEFEEIYLYLRSLGCEVCILTNGYLLDDRFIEFFKHHKPELMKITLYGWNDDVYERVTGRRVFNNVMENIQKVIDVGIPVSLSVTPSVYLGEDVFETIKLGKKITKSFFVNSSLFSPREETGRSKQADDSDVNLYIRIYQLLNELDGIQAKEIDENKLPPVGGTIHQSDQCGLLCGGGRSTFVITWKGTLIPCNRLDIIKAYPVKDGFKNAWIKINQEANNWPRVPECNGCAYREVCNNCAANMLQYSKPGKQPLELCKRTKLFVKQGITHIQECE